MKVAATLLVWVFLTHFAYDQIAQATGIHRATVFYVFMGVWTALLCLFVQYLLWSRRQELAVKLVILATGIGAIEGLQMLCLLFGPIPDGVNACDYHAGLPITVTSATVYVLYIAWSLRRK